MLQDRAECIFTLHQGVKWDMRGGQHLRHVDQVSQVIESLCSVDKLTGE